MMHILNEVYPMLLSGGITILTVIDVVGNIRNPPPIRTDLFTQDKQT